MRLIVALLLLAQYAQALSMASARCAKVVRELLPNNQRSLSTAFIISHQTAKDFVQGVAEAADATDILYRLSKSREGCSVVRRVMSASVVFNDVVAPFLDWLSQDCLSKGICARAQQAILEDIWRTPGLADSMLEAVEQQRLPDERSVAWLLDRLCFASGSAAVQAREDAVIKRIAEHLLLRTDAPAVQQRAMRIWQASHPGQQLPQQQQQQRLQQSTASASDSSRPLSEAQEVAPGGRHDNDFADFRSVQNVPTIGELASDKFPFLPSPQEDWPALDRQYRLLRHDLVSSIREKL
eukprot:13222-Heterococcus_DN1.PRE.2